MNTKELVEDIQAELCEARAESVDLTDYLTDAECCEESLDLLENLKAAEIAAKNILESVQEQLERCKVFRAKKFEKST